MLPIVLHQSMQQSLRPSRGTLIGKKGCNKSNLKNENESLREEFSHFCTAGQSLPGVWRYHVSHLGFLSNIWKELGNSLFHNAVITARTNGMFCISPCNCLHSFFFIHKHEFITRSFVSICAMKASVELRVAIAALFMRTNVQTKYVFQQTVLIESTQRASH